MQDGIQGPRAQPVSMAGQFLNNSKAEDFFFRSMVQNVQPDQRGVQLRIILRLASLLGHGVVSNSDNEIRKFTSHSYLFGSIEDQRKKSTPQPMNSQACNRSET